MPEFTCLSCGKQFSSSTPQCPQCTANTNSDVQPAAKASKGIGLLLGLGILFAPVLFAWLTLRKGYSAFSKGIAFTWLALSLLVIGLSSNNTAPVASNPAASVEKTTGQQAVQARTAASTKATPVKAETTANNVEAVASPSVNNNPQSVYSAAQQNAIRRAKEYLAMQGFSRDGLIQQLSSRAGEGYAEADAIIAVDSLTVNWQAEALESAKEYVSARAFSREGLIRQLSSSAGEKHTLQDATNAVDSMSVNWNDEAAEAAKDYLQMQAFSCDGLIKQLSSSAGEKFTESEATYGAQQTGICQ